MKTAFITAQTPFGTKEQFILPEIIEYKNRGNEVVVLPVRPDKGLFEGEEPRTVAEYTLPIPLFSAGVVLLGFSVALMHPIRTPKILFKILTNSGSPTKVLKNLSVFFKGVTISEVCLRRKVDHIHAHWASTTSTAAYIASRITGIPWSFTCHRWDIFEDNMLKEKVKSAKFVRVINDIGYQEVTEIAGNASKDKCFKLHVGINMDRELNTKRIQGETFRIAMPANMVDVKGHIYLIEAIESLVKEGHKIQCNLYGTGELEASLKNDVEKRGLKDIILFNGKLPHDKLLSLFGSGEVDCVVLPSIVTPSEKEGIPVSLMEAMSYRIPVISTNTGGIPELLHDNAGVIVPEKNSKAIAEGILKLMQDEEYYHEVAELGHKRVCEEFYLPDIIDELVELMKK